MGAYPSLKRSSSIRYTSEEAGLEVNAEKTETMFLSQHLNPGKIIM